MNFLRNPEIRRSIVLYLVITLIIVAMGYYLPEYKGKERALALLVLCLIFASFHFLYTYKRYRKIAALSADLDKILHGDNQIVLMDYSEGELSILQNEVNKLILRLKEQSEALLKDKILLSSALADISHQIKTPLTSLNLMISMMHNPNLSESDKTARLKEMGMLLNRMEWLISTLLKLSRFDAGAVKLKKEIIKISHLLKLSTDLIAIPMELRGQQIIIELQSGDEEFTGDLFWTVEAICNILKNCMEHMGDGNIIRIKALENALYTEIKISDNGPGIPEGDLSYLFERFYKGKNSDEQSAGIGLALARVIIKNQNGTIKAENGFTGGAVFTIRFYKTTI